MSDTPRTDAEFLRILNDPETPLNCEIDRMAIFARQLERENAELLEALEDLEALGSLELPHRRDAALLKAKAAINKAKGITNE